MKQIKIDELQEQFASESSREVNFEYKGRTIKVSDFTFTGFDYDDEDKTEVYATKFAFTITMPGGNFEERVRAWIRPDGDVEDDFSEEFYDTLAGHENTESELHDFQLELWTEVLPGLLEQFESSTGIRVWA